MILYADTSALVKKYIQEAGSEQAGELFDGQPVIGTVALTMVEMAAAMALAVRQGWLDESETSAAWQDFLSHWPAYVRLPVSTAILERSASLAWRHGLRAYDSIHLAGALTWQEATGEGVVFACFDRQLLQAALQEGLQVWPENVG